MSEIPVDYDPERITCSLTNSSNPSYIIILDNDSVNTIPRKVLFIETAEKSDNILDIIASTSTLSNGTRPSDPEDNSASNSGNGNNCASYLTCHFIKSLHC